MRSGTAHAREDQYHPSASSSGARSAARGDQGLRSCRADKTVALPAKVHQICPMAELGCGSWLWLAAPV